MSYFEQKQISIIRICDNKTQYGFVPRVRRKKTPLASCVRYKSTTYVLIQINDSLLNGYEWGGEKYNVSILQTSWPAGHWPRNLIGQWNDVMRYR